ncbi:MAG TPA: aminotransferase class IV [Thermoanaerobaculia bacterium]|nr:aminotransferase class IV [Thermoanaerobaculia bacterium]
MTQIAADSPAVAHGVGLFETMLVTRGRIILAPEHFARMHRSAELLGFPLPDHAAFDDELVRACACVVHDEVALRCLYVAGGATVDDRWTLAAQCTPIPPLTLARRTHARAITLEPSLTRALPQHKLTSYAPCVIGLRTAVVAGANEGLFITPAAEVLEGTATNVFAVAGNRLITAPVSAGVLPGTVRAWLLTEAARLGIEIEERPPTAAEITTGALLTGSLTGVVPLRVLDGRPCGEATPLAQVLIQRWAAFATQA